MRLHTKRRGHGLEKKILIVLKSNVIKTNHLKVKINNMQRNSECRLCGKREETANHIINEYSKLALKENKTGRDMVGKIIHYELCKRLKFDHTHKRYMHKLESVLKKDTHEII